MNITFKSIFKMVLMIPLIVIALLFYIPYGIFKGLANEEIIKQYLRCLDNFMNVFDKYLFRKEK